MRLWTKCLNVFQATTVGTISSTQNAMFKVGQILRSVGLLDDQSQILSWPELNSTALRLSKFTYETLGGSKGLAQRSPKSGAGRHTFCFPWEWKNFHGAELPLELRGRLLITDTAHRACTSSQQARLSYLTYWKALVCDPDPYT